MEQRKLYYALAVLLLFGGTWLLLSGNKEKSPDRTPDKAASKVGASPLGESQSVASTPVIKKKKRARASATPALVAEEVKPTKSEERVYENPADNPDSWSDFQAAIYVYKDEVLGPRIKECWHLVGGDGRINTAHEFEIVNGIARPRMAALEEGGEVVPSIVLDEEHTAFSDEELSAALKCLRLASEGTEFHFVGFNGETEVNDRFTGHWGWASPAFIDKERGSQP